jgi:hypothetical protein
LNDSSNSRRQHTLEEESEEGVDGSDEEHGTDEQANVGESLVNEPGREPAGKPRQR